jgi:hypothetical protein
MTLVHPSPEFMGSRSFKRQIPRQRKKERPVLTIFALPKPFKGHSGVIQRNAISQWARLRPKPEILLFGNEKGTSEIAEELGLRHIPEVDRNEFGTALLSDLFEKAHALASHETLCYVNADIILLGQFMKAVQQVAAWRDRFLMVGRRTGVDLDEPAIYESAEQAERLMALVSQRGQLGTPFAIDYFVFPRGLFPALPPFAIGRPWWDDWMLWKARKSNAALVDASEVVLAVHQNHDYSHLPPGREKVMDCEEARLNRRLAGRGLRTIDDSTHKLTPRGIELIPKPFFSSTKRAAQIWWWQFLRVTAPIRYRLGLRQQNIVGMLGRIKLFSSR